MESMRIVLDKPTVTFALGDADLVSFDFYELNDVIDKEYQALEVDPKAHVADGVRQWMISKGLPETVTVRMVADWMMALDKALADKVKKANGS